MRRRNHRGAFTLIELIVVLAIASLIMLAAAPSFVGFARTARLRGAARDVASALNSARRFAITQNMNRAVSIYGNDYHEEEMKNSFQYWETSESPLPDRRLLPATVRITSPDEIITFTFSPRGTASSGGTVVLEDTMGRELRVIVLGPTGRVRIEE